ncbi:MAG TPA: hypothetical protein VGF24_33150 [Vicinamibacterales bacterium]|jgi:hypothetical protein
MTTRRRAATSAATLAPEDVYLMSFGPWCPLAAVPSTDSRGPYWHPRVNTERIKALWKLHRRAIRDCWKAHPELRDQLSEQTPWCQERLWFVRQLADARSRGTIIE